jgi:DNA-binding response OmpR family regulator
MTKTKILYVEDEPFLGRIVKESLESRDFEVTMIVDGRDAIGKFLASKPDICVLDVMLPKLDGFDVCRRLRSQGDQTPVIMLTARDEDIDKILGLELGADDYLTKPFNPRELIARARAILRRSDNQKQAEGKPIHRGQLMIDPSSREVRVADQTLELRTQEFDLLLTLAEQPGRVFTREQLLKQAWGFDFYGQTRTVDVHIAHLRRKLEDGPVKIETVTGVGYKLVV